MKNMKVATKLLTSFSLVVFLVLVISAGGLYGLFRMSGICADMYENKALPLGDLAMATEYFQRLRVQTRNAIIYTGDTEHLNTVDVDMKERITQFETSMSSYKPSITTDEGKRLFDEIMSQYNATFKPGILDVLDKAKQGETINALLQSMASTTDAANVIADNLSDLTQARMGVMKAADDESTRVQNLIFFCDILVVLFVVSISIGLALYISSLISKPLALLTNFMTKAGTTGDISLSKDDVENINRCAEVKDEVGECIGSTARFVNRLAVISKIMETISNGDLSSDVNLLSAQDTMGISLKKMLESLNDMFGEIHMSTTQVSIGSRQMAEGAQMLAQGSTEQASAVEELSSSIEEISEKTKVNADMADKAARLAGEIKGNAEKGSHQMNEMMDAVKEINQAGQSINKVIKVIDDIAFQTNILALNASVEAARAGAHGKGFAVVAEEVRNLAAKSAEAAKDTGELIENSIEKAELGSRIADETAASLSEIVTGINESSEIVEKIAESSKEQSASISQINKGINQVAQVVQQNSATAEESSASSEEMSGQADILEELVSRFKLKNNGEMKMSTKPQIKIDMSDKAVYSNNTPQISSSDYGKY